MIYSETILTGNCLVGASSDGKSSVLKHYAYLCGQELLEFNPSALLMKEAPTAQLLSFIKVVISTGSWLFLRRVDRLAEEQLALVAECMISVAEALR